MTELKQFKLPDVGEGLTEADIVKWHVQPGDKVTINQVIVEIETAKAVVELPSPFEGVVSELLAAEGATVDVGTPIVSVTIGAAGPGAGTAGEAGGAAESAAPGAPVATGAPRGAEVPAEAAEVTAPRAGRPPVGERTGAAALPAAEAVAGTEETGRGETGAGEAGMGETAPEGGKRQAVLVGYGVKLGRTTRRARKSPGPPPGPSAADSGSAAALATSVTSAPSATQDTADPATAADGPGRARNGAGAHAMAKPPVRKLAKDLGVDLGTLAGTGPHGSITRDDVRQAAARPGPADTGLAVEGPAGGGLPGGRAAAVAALPREERVPIRGVRKHTAAAVATSAFTAPHVTEFLQVDVTASAEALARLRALPEFSGLRVSPLLLAARALIVAIGRHPMINSSWDEQAQEIVIRHYVNLGIAAATDRGLVVPNIKDAQALSLPALARALGQLAETARAGKASQADLRDGTITITNVGVFGVDSGTPILTPGEAAILALGRIRDAPWVHDGQLAVRKVTTLALSFDHRVVDGDLGSAVLSDIGAMLEDPLRILAWA